MVATIRRWEGTSFYYGPLLEFVEGPLLRLVSEFIHSLDPKLHVFVRNLSRMSPPTQRSLLHFKIYWRERGLWFFVDAAVPFLEISLEVGGGKAPILACRLRDRTLADEVEKLLTDFADSLGIGMVSLYLEGG